MFRGVCIFAALTAVWLVAGGCSQESGERFGRATDRFAVAGSPLVVALPAQGALLDEFLTLVVNVEGTEGVLDLVKAASGVDLSEEDLLARAGLDPEFAPLLFSYRDCPVLVAGLSDGQTFLRFVKETAARIGIEPTVTRTDSVDIHALPSGLSYAVVGNLAVFLNRPAGLSVETLAALLLEPRAEGQEPFPADRVTLRIVRAGAARAQVPVAQPLTGDDTVGGKDGEDANGGNGWSLEELAASAGPLAGVVRAVARFTDSCRSIEAEVIPGDRYRFTLALTGCTLPFTTGNDGEPEALVPEDAVLLVQTALPGDSLWGTLSPVWQTLARFGLNQVNGKVPEGLRDAAALLGRFEPRFSLAFLGLSPLASVDTFTNARTPADPFFALHLELLLTLKEGAVLDDLLDPAVVEALAGEVESTELSSGDLFGRELCKEDEKAGRRCISILRKGREVLLVTGPGEGPRLARTVLGQRKRLSESLFVELKRGPMTLTLKTRRLVRDLMSKGFPPYFLQVLSSVLELRVTVGTEGEVTRFGGEVVLR
jgi:hypothetical protein